jgi:hypothetical protein
MATVLSTTVRRGLLLATLLSLFAFSAQSAERKKKSTEETSLAANLSLAAMKCELAGDNEKRNSLLRETLEHSPGDILAHWQLGYIRSEDKKSWFSLDDAEKAAQNDPRLAEYRQMRLESFSLPFNSKDLELAKWCRQNKLENEERAHWNAVLQREPNNLEARQALGMQLYRGLLLDRKQVAQMKETIQRQAKSLDRFRPLVNKIQKSLDRSEPIPQEIRDKIMSIADPAEMLALQQLIVQRADGKDSLLQSLTLSLAQMLRENPHPVAAACLAQIAGTTEAEDVRAETVEGLELHPMDHYVPLLLAQMRTVAVTDFRWTRQLDGTLIPFIGTGDTRDSVAREGVVADNAASVNREVAEHNAHIVEVLRQTTKLDHGDQPMNWWTWWWEDFNDQAEIRKNVDATRGGFANTYLVAPYVSRDSNGSDYESDIVKKAYTPQPILYPQPRTYDGIAPANAFIRRGPVVGPVFRNSECFTPGTMVWTQTGRMPIERVMVGDRVLSQDVNTGELAYKPVLGRTMREPQPRIKIEIGGESITSTGSHPYWANGNGWLLAKQLEVGARLHGISGSVPVANITEVKTESGPNGISYNLIVADFNTYFVGEQGILVHDNTPRQPTSALLPGLLADRAK